MKDLEHQANIKEEIIKERESNEEEEEEEQTKSITIRKFFSSEAFDYMREMVEKRKEAERKVEAREKAAKSKKKKKLDLAMEEEEILDLNRVQQLFAYVEQRYHQDPRGCLRRCL